MDGGEEKKTDMDPCPHGAFGKKIRYVENSSGGEIAVLHQVVRGGLNEEMEFQ